MPMSMAKIKRHVSQRPHNVLCALSTRVLDAYLGLNTSEKPKTFHAYSTPNIHRSAITLEPLMGDVNKIHSLMAMTLVKGWDI